MTQCLKITYSLIFSMTLTAKTYDNDVMETKKQLKKSVRTGLMNFCFFSLSTSRG